MSSRGRVALAHGGAEADPRHADGPRRAAAAAVARMESGASALDAVVEAVRILEDDERFNAGRGSNLRLDGHTISMDAAIVDSAGRFAGVIGLDDVRNPVLVARDVLDTPHPVLAAPGATRFARLRGHPPHDPRTDGARERLPRVSRELRVSPTASPWSLESLSDSWNYTRPMLAPREAAGPTRECDTVGAVAFDGESLAAAGSTGGLVAVLDGRVSDIALPGCGLDASPHGAVCVSGIGAEIIRARVATRVLRMLEHGAGPAAAADDALRWVPKQYALAILVLDEREASAARGHGPFPWDRAESPS